MVGITMEDSTEELEPKKGSLLAEIIMMKT